LTGTTLSWFAPLLEANSLLLNNFEEFIKEFKACFGDTDSVRTTINKICTLRQGDQPVSTYAANFRLIAITAGARRQRLTWKTRTRLEENQIRTRRKDWYYQETWSTRRRRLALNRNSSILRLAQYLYCF
jgi:hypothetical protein